MTLKEDLTEGQLKAIEELRRRTIKDLSTKLLEDESVFYRFLKARDFNVDKAEAMLRKHIAWRKEFKVDTILTDYQEPEVMKKYVPTSVIGYDEEGSLVRYCDFGNADAKGIIHSAKKIDLVKFAIKHLELDMRLLKQQSDKLGVPIFRAIYIINYEHLTFAKATNKQIVELLLYLMKMQQDNYPETVKRLYLINGSIYFTVIWSLVKHVVASALLEKIRIFGTDGWQKILLEKMGSDQLPAFLGGNKTDPNGNPLCETFVIHGRDVPKSHYLQKSTKSLMTMSGAKKLKLYPFAKTRIDLEVVDPNSYLEWEFETKANDIGFGVYFKETSSEESEEIEMVPNQRFDTYYESEAGLYKCKRPGIYTILFDNSYSWIRPKEIYYRTRIIKPNEEENENEI